MIGLYIITFLTIISLISVVLFKPEVKLFKLKLETFWLVTSLGMCFLVIFRYISPFEIYQGLTKETSINPINILILFLSMTILSIILDELGFFSQLAALALNKAGGKQIKLFLYLYGIVSLLTIFTSNDIIILTFTPFICYFTKYAKINPIPYLMAEFVGANTWSMILIIGNPTNIYLASSYQIGFMSYFTTMALPSIASALLALGLLLLIFKKSLTKDTISYEKLSIKLKHKRIVIIALIHLSLCTILLSISSYLNWSMWLIALFFCSFMCLILLIFDLITYKKPYVILKTLKRAPWSLAPFILSMFIFVLTLSKFGVTYKIYELLSIGPNIWTYGLTSFLTSNIINNIPMTVLYSDIISHISINQIPAIYASIIGSNIGAYLTPLGALAGIMWMRILKKEKILFSFKDFIKYGILISIPTIVVALLSLNLII